jgi:TetR/AcrR family transcriptional repressor of bet genes
MGLQKVMARRGYERATIAAIAEEAGLTAGLVHYHFRSKQDILLVLVETLAVRLDQRYGRFLKGTSPQARLAAFIDAHLALGEGADPDAVACWVSIGSEALRLPEVGELYRSLLLSRREQLERLLAELPEPPERPRDAAAAILATIEGCYQLAAAVPEIASPGFAAESLRKMVGGLAGVRLPGSHLKD